MAASLIESALFAGTYADPEMRRIFDDENLVRCLLAVEAALAEAEGELGLIPAEAAAEIARRAREETFSLEELGAEIGRTAHLLVPLVRALARRLGPAGHYVHWGATTQDIMDTANMLRFREAVRRVTDLLQALREAAADLAGREADTVMAGRTHGQHALPITFGFKAAGWAWEFERQRVRWQEAAPRVLVGNLTGAVGTFAGFGPQGEDVQARALTKLGLGIPEMCWHAARDRIGELAALVVLTAGTAERVAQEVFRLASTDYGEVEEPFHHGKVGSSTMPHKRNPALAEAVLTSVRAARAEASMVFGAMAQEHERHSGLWKVEWVGLPHAFILLGNALAKLGDVLRGLRVDRAAMARNLRRTGGLILSEAVMLALGRRIGRDAAHDRVYEASMTAVESGRPFRDVLREDPLFADWSEADWERVFDARRYLGLAPEIARRTARLLGTRDTAGP
ncbi:MAG: adenylosuccinate lyase family protein [Actinomycetia bacterium]|nr:adenylosuccinate lyase family protein [Actinomycetes bacterium]